jgi:hypothetical protein
MAMASEGEQALAIGAIKIGTRRLNCSQNAAVRARAGRCGMCGQFTSVLRGIRGQYQPAVLA